MKELKITTGVAAALLAAGCGQQQAQDNGWTADRDTAVCVDQQGKRVPDDQCPRQHVASTGHAGMSPFLWYYLGRMSSVPYYGERVTGGGYAPATGHSYFRAPSSTGMTRSAAIARGGFGSSARGFFGAWRRLVIRRTLTPRPDWRAKVEAEGLIWHGAGEQPYWDEGACYSFTLAEIEGVEAATAELYRLFLAAGQAIVDDQRLMDRFHIPPAFHQPIRDAWNAEPPALNFGRFDLGYDGAGPPKLFEFNCDTPTSLLEAAVIQWSWKEEVFPAADQFTSLHDKLVAKWRDLAPDLPARLHFAHVDDAAGEDAVTTSYLRDTAEAAGIATVPILVDDVGWDADHRCFADLDGERIEGLFKLYPWEWLANEAFAPQLIESLADTIWIEPVWKMIWSNKAILPILWQLHPGHPNLLATSVDVPTGDAVAKPLLAREGANVSIRRAGAILAETAGDYGGEGYIYQDIYRLPETAPGCFPVIGSWVVDGEPAGMGIREDGLITTNTARFVPHVIEG